VSNNIGRLIQAYITVIWDKTNLSFYDDGEGGKQILAQNVKINIPKEGAAPTLDFSITPNPIGFKTFTELKNNSIDKPIKVTIGYPNSETKVEFSFRFVGFNLTTGFDPKIEINCVSVAKGSFTDNRISYTLEKPIKLSELPELLKKKAGQGAKDLTFEWVGQAKEIAEKVQYQENVINRTPYSVLTDALRPHGIEVQANDSVLDGTIILSYNPSLKGEQEKDKPEVVDKGAKVKAAVRNVYIIGPGLMQNINRKQTFGAGQSDPTGGTAGDKKKSKEQEQKNVEQGTAGAQQKSSAESTNTQGGTLSTPNQSSQQSRTPEAQSKKAEEARAAVSASLQTQIDFQVPLVPNILGIRARDFCVIPSLKGPGEYLEDWSINDVTYTQQADGDITVSVNGFRPFTGKENLLDSGTISKVEGIVSKLKTPANWNKFYYIEGNDPDYPLGG
jgi:hypothetical protein